MQIHWYPGHMAKAKRLLGESLKLVDLVIELVDARAPLSTKNPDIDALCEGKARIILLNKSDMADTAGLERWLAYYRAKGFLAAAAIASNKRGRQKVLGLIEEAAAEKLARFRQRGIKKTLRAMVAGIPNVGKSTLINTIAGGARAQVGDRPGVTKGKQWVSITPYLELMDTPGLLWPKLADPHAAENLAFIGSIRDDALEVEALACRMLERLSAICPKELCGRYPKLTGESGEAMLLSLCAGRGFLLHGGKMDTLRGARAVLDEYRAGKIARITLDQPVETGDAQPWQP